VASRNASVLCLTHAPHVPPADGSVRFPFGQRR
jgi:hypothetical protein